MRERMIMIIELLALSTCIIIIVHTLIIIIIIITIIIRSVMKFPNYLFIMIIDNFKDICGQELRGEPKNLSNL